MKELYNRFVSWSHTPEGDGILCGIILVVVILAAYAFMWAGWICNFN